MERRFSTTGFSLAAVENVKRLLQKRSSRNESVCSFRRFAWIATSSSTRSKVGPRESLNTFSITMSLRRITTRVADGCLFIRWLSLIDLYCVAYTLLAMARKRGRRTESETRAYIIVLTEGPLLFQTNDPLIGPSLFPILLSHASRPTRAWLISRVNLGLP